MNRPARLQHSRRIVNRLSRNSLEKRGAAALFRMKWLTSNETARTPVVANLYSNVCRAPERDIAMSGPQR